VSRHVLGRSGLRNLEAELEQLTVDSRSSPERVCGGHLADQRPKFWIDPWPSRPTKRLASPVAAESSPVPANDGCRLNEEESPFPAIPKPPQAGPDQAICGAEAPERQRSSGGWSFDERQGLVTGGRPGFPIGRVRH